MPETMLASDRNLAREQLFTLVPDEYVWLSYVVDRSEAQVVGRVLRITAQYVYVSFFNATPPPFSKSSGNVKGHRDTGLRIIARASAEDFAAHSRKALTRPRAHRMPTLGDLIGLDFPSQQEQDSFLQALTRQPDTASMRKLVDQVQALPTETSKTEVAN